VRWPCVPAPPVLYYVMEENLPDIEALWGQHKRVIDLLDRGFGLGEIAATVGWSLEVVEKMVESRFMEETAALREGNGK
jgi:hypothetical protein